MVVVELGSCCVSMGCLPRHFSWELLWQRLTVPKMADAGRQTDVVFAMIQTNTKLLG